MTALMVALASVACNPDHLLDVEDIDVLDPSTLNRKEALPQLLASTLPVKLASRSAPVSEPSFTSN